MSPAIEAMLLDYAMWLYKNHPEKLTEEQKQYITAAS